MELIFVSYSRRQLYFAESAVLHLQWAGLDVWFDLQKLTPEEEANTHIIIVSNRTSKQWLLDLDQNLSGQVMHILATNINTPPDFQPVLQSQ